MRRGKYRLLVHKDFANSQLTNHLAGGIEELKKHYQLVHVPSSDTALIYKFNVAGDILYYKQHRFRDWRDVIKHTFRPSRSMRAMKGTLTLTNNGLKAPEIITVAERMVGPLCLENFTIARQLPGSTTLYELIKNIVCKKTTVILADKRRLVRSLGNTIGFMHSKNICQGDLRLGNIMILENNGKFDFAFLDNERTRHFRNLPIKLQIKNLVQLNMSRAFFSKTDVIRFWKEYSKYNNQMRPSQRDMLKEIKNITDKRLRSRAQRKNTTIMPDAVLPSQ